ncbi:MAG: hypothetical protein WCG28_03015 [bacterium]
MKTNLVASLVLAVSMLTSLAAGNLNVAINNYNTEPVLPGSINRSVYVITFDATGMDEDVKVTSITPNLQTQNGCESAFMANWSLFTQGYQIGSMASMIPFTFNLGSSFIIAKGSIETVALRCDIQFSAHGEFSVSIDQVSAISMASGNTIKAIPVATTLMVTQILGLPSMGRGGLDFSISNGIGNFTIHGMWNYRYQIEESFDLKSWHAISEILTAPPANVSLPVGTNAHAFYRFQEFLPSKLIVSTDASSPVYQVVSAGTKGVIVGVYKFSAFYEDFSFNQIGLKLTHGKSESITTVSIWDGNTQIGWSVPFINGVARLFAANLLIPKNSGKRLTVKADLSNIGIGEAGTSGDLIKIDCDTDSTLGHVGSYFISTSGETHVAGIRVFKSLPIITLEPLPSGNLVSGEQALLRFSIAADSAGDISIATLMAKVGCAGATVANCNIYRLDDNSKLMATNSNPVAQSWMIFSVNVENADGVQTPLQIPAGGIYHFELRGTVIPDSGATTWYVTTKLVEDYPFANPDFIIGTWQQVVSQQPIWPPEDSVAIVWSPDSLGTPGLNDPDWTNGFGLRFPPDGILQIRTN